MKQFMQLKMENTSNSIKVKEIEHPYHNMFHATFDDGYENIFFTDVQTGKWIEEDLGETELALQFGKEIKNMGKEVWKCPKIIHWIKSDDDEYFVHFGFYKYRKGNNFVYEIYGSNLKFKYSLLKRDFENWEILNPFNTILENENIRAIKLIAEILVDYNF